MDRESLDMINWIRRLPKTELHLHSEAVVQFMTYMQLNEKYNIDSSLVTIDDYKKNMNFNNLTDMIQCFLHLQTFFREEEDFLLMAEDILSYAYANNIYYLEVFFSPSTLIKLNYVDYFAVLDLLTNSFAEIKHKYHIQVNMIIDVSRSFGPPNAMNNLDLLLKYLKTHSNKHILGIGLGGAEAGNSCRNYKAVFDIARRRGLHVVAHAGEEVNSQSIWDAIKLLGVERIGHGTSAVYDEKLMKYLIKKKIPLEICPTSNIITGKYVKMYSEHPFKIFFDSGVYVTINTDDPILFNTNLNKEYYKLYKFLNFSKADLLKVAYNSLNATFLSKKEKAKHWKRIEESVSI